MRIDTKIAKQANKYITELYNLKDELFEDPKHRFSTNSWRAIYNRYELSKRLVRVPIAKEVISNLEITKVIVDRIIDSRQLKNEYLEEMLDIRDKIESLLLINMLSKEE